MDEFKVVFVPRSRTDLHSIVTFVASRSSSEIGERRGMTLIRKALTLSSMPARGRIVPELRDPKVREIFFKSYRIVYRIHGREVQVLRFWHGARGAPEIDSDEFSAGL